MSVTSEFYISETSKYNLTVNIGELTPSGILDGKVVLISGASKGIGFSTAQKCIKQNAKVIITGRNEDALINAKNALGDKCAYYKLDMKNVSEFDEALEKMTSFFGKIDCVVNNAGISLHEGDIKNVTEQTYDEQMEINLKGPYFLIKSWLNYYDKYDLRSGRIVMMASDTSGMGSTIPYGLSKAAISSFTRGLAKHIIKKGIRINAVAPGTTLTDMTADFVKGEIIRDTTSGNRVLFPEEIAEICVFLLSDASACISGNVFGCTEANICFDNVTNLFCGETETNP